MPKSLYRRAGALALLAALSVPQAGALSNVSAWAQPEVSAAQDAGLMPSSLATSAAQGAITRQEFCSVAVNVYKAVTGKAVFASGKRPFRDCDDPSVVAAYELGLVSGYGNGIFKPDDTIKRQDLCVMLNNVVQAAGIDAPANTGDACLEEFSDVAAVSSYALDAATRMVDYDVVGGVKHNDGTTTLSPADTASREQALIMANRFTTTFRGMIDPEQGPSTPSTPEDDTPSVTPDTSLPQTDEEKWALVYGTSDQKYQTAEEAEANIVEVAVPVWRLQADGTKTAGTAYIEVNRNLASIVEDIFEEIFNGDEQFPIKNVGGYSWRTGEHSQGTAIDINWEENMEATINADGSLTPTTGSYWLPGEDPYSIPEGGDVYNAFISHGFLWGGTAWRSKRDYMHFSYFGT